MNGDVAGVLDAGDLRSVASVLKRMGAAPSAVVRAEPAGALGSLSRLTRIRVMPAHSADETNVFTLMLKRESENPSAVAVTELLDSLRREHGFYATLPQVADEVSLRCWDAQFVQSTGLVRILLEDAGQQSLPTQRVGCPLDVAEEVVALLAKLHMTTGNLSAVTDLDWCPSWGDGITSKVAAKYAETWPAFERQYSGLLSAEALDVAGRLPRQMVGLAAEWESTARSLSVIHGDARLDNVVRRQDGSVRLIDWQMATWAEGAFDLAHFLAGSLTTEDRRLNETHLLDVYRGEQRSLGCSVLGRAELEDAVRRTALFVLPLNVIFGTVAASESITESRRIVLDRYFTAITEWSSGDFLRG